jgi:hypothetical protein
MTKTNVSLRIMNNFLITQLWCTHRNNLLLAHTPEFKHVNIPDRTANHCLQYYLTLNFDRDLP